MKRNYSFWELNAGVDTLPLSSQSLPHTTEVLIVGAGFSGSWLAYHLKSQNPKLPITIIERDFINLGASLRNAGFLSAGNISEWLEDSKELSWEETVNTLKARIEGINLIRQFAPTLAAAPYCGSVDADPLTEEKTDLLQKLNNELKKMQLDPFFETKKMCIGKITAERAFNRFDGEVNPHDLLSSLHAFLKIQEVQFIQNCIVKKIEKGVAVIEADGKEKNLSYQYAFICTNGFTKTLNSSTCVEPARGQIIVTSECETNTVKSLGFLRSGYDYFRFIGKRVLVGGGRLEYKKQEETDSLEPTSAIREYLINLAQEVIGHDKFTVDYHWAGTMGLRKGKHASISDLNTRVFIDSQTEEVAGFGGWGVTLTPLVTKNIAQRFL